MRVLRYPGGKKRMLKYLSQFIPNVNEIKGKYYEPFVGGGAVITWLKPRAAVISDINPELICLYRGIQENPEEVWHHFSRFPSGKKVYYQIRDNQLLEDSLSFRAARILYLNRTCFKGMWRHGPDGKFNVGYGGEDRRWVVTKENLIQFSEILAPVNILNCDFEDVMKNVEEGDFVFLDPPYKPGERYLKEAHYAMGSFAFEEQERLANQIIMLSRQKKIRWVMTNSAHKDIRHLYRDFYIHPIPKGTGTRPGIMTDQSKEIIITNYRV